MAICCMVATPAAAEIWNWNFRVTDPNANEVLVATGNGTFDASLVASDNSTNYWQINSGSGNLNAFGVNHQLTVFGSPFGLLRFLEYKSELGDGKIPGLIAYTANFDFGMQLLQYQTPLQQFITNFSTTGSQPYRGLFYITLPASAVPEPTSWAMLIGGFGLLGGAMRRRVTQVTYQTA